MHPGGLTAVSALALLSLPLLSTSAAAAAGEPGNEPVEDASETEVIVVYGVRTGRFALDPSALSTSIELADLEGEHMRLDQILSQSVGVQVRNFGGAGDRAEVSIRGSTASQVVVLLDGVRVNSELTGAVDLSSFPVELLERIEIVRGGGSTEYGSGAMGGVINLITRRPKAEPQASFSFSGGSFGTWDGSISGGGRIKGVDSSFGYQGFKTDGDFEFLRPVYILEDGTPSPPDAEYRTAVRVNNRTERHSGSLSLGKALGERGILRLSENLSYVSQGQPGLDAGSGQSAGQQLEAHQRDFRSLTQLDWRGADPSPLGRALDGELESSAYYRFERLHFRDPHPALNPDEAIDSRQDLSEAGFALSGSWEQSFGQTRAGEKPAQEPAAWLRWLELTHRPAAKVDGRWDGLKANDRDGRGRFTGGVRIADELELFGGALLLSPALRVTWTEGFDSEWLPRLGLVWSALPWLRLRGNIERSFRTPNFNELYFPDKGFISGNPELEPEQARNADIGLELVFDRLGLLGEVELSAAYFHSKIEQSIVWLLISPFRIEPRNTGRATSQGAEISLDLRPISLLGLTTNYTYTDATRDATGSPLPGRAEHEVNVRLELAQSELWKLITDYHYTGAIAVQEGGAAIIQPRSTWSGSASLNLAALPKVAELTRLDTLWGFLRVDNIGDVSQRDARFFPQPGRSLSLGLEGKW
jgi:vitamin B12 transporter